MLISLSSIPDFSAQPGINTELNGVENAIPISTLQLILMTLQSHIKTKIDGYAADLATKEQFRNRLFLKT